MQHAQIYNVQSDCDALSEIKSKFCSIVHTHCSQMIAADADTEIPSCADKQSIKSCETVREGNGHGFVSIL